MTRLDLSCWTGVVVFIILMIELLWGWINFKNSIPNNQMTYFKESENGNEDTENELDDAEEEH